MRGLRLGLGLGLLFAAGACEPIYLSEPRIEPEGTVHAGVISASETWREDDNPHRVTGRLLVSGPDSPTLTLEPGVRVLFERGGELAIGDRDSGPGALRALGSEGDPVRFMSELEYASPGYWNGLRFHWSAKPSELRHATLSDCGAEDGPFPQACLVITGFDTGGPEILVRDVTVGYSRGYGAVAFSGAGFAEGSRNLSVVSARQSAIRIDADQAHTLPPGGSFVGDVPPTVQVHGGTVTTTQTWPDLGIPYFVSRVLRVAGPQSPVLTLAAGAELLFARDAGLEVGTRGEKGSLVAVGRSAADPVIFGAADEAISWRGIVLGADASSDTRLLDVVVEGAGLPNGYASANVTFVRDLGPVLRGGTIRGSRGCGVVRLLVGFEWSTDFTDPSLGNVFANNAGGDQCTHAEQ